MSARRDILEFIRMNPGSLIWEIADGTGYAVSTIHRELREIRDRTVISCDREGRFRPYTECHVREDAQPYMDGYFREIITRFRHWQRMNELLPNGHSPTTWPPPQSPAANGPAA